MKPLLALPPHIEPIIEPIDLELSDSLKAHIEFTRKAQETIFENYYMGIKIIKENPELEGKTLPEIFAYLKAKMKQQWT